VIVTTRMGVNRQESALCTRMALAKAIVGQWVNSRAGVIYFYADKTGYIPGDERQTPPIPSVKFSYYFQDDVHLGIKMDGQNPIVIEIKLEDDKMTWLNRDNNVEYVYTKMN
jgi:hypothetical protein